MLGTMKPLIMTGLLVFTSLAAGQAAQVPSLSNNYRTPASQAAQTNALRTLAPYLSNGQIINWAQVLRTNVTRSGYAAYLEAARIYYADIRPDKTLLMVYETLPPTTVFPSEEISGPQAQAYVAQGLINLEAAGLPAGVNAAGTPIKASPSAATQAAASLVAAPVTVNTTALFTQAPPTASTTPAVWSAEQTPASAAAVTASAQTPAISGPSTARLVLARPLISAGLITVTPAGNKLIVSRADGQGGQSLITPGQIGVKWRAAKAAAWNPNRPTAGSPLPAMTRIVAGRLAVPDEALEALGCAVVMAGEAVNVACGLQTATTERALSAPLTPQQSSEVPSPLRR